MATPSVRPAMTIAELDALMAGGAPPTSDDQSRTCDGRVLDSKKKVLYFLARLDEQRSGEEQVPAEQSGQ